MVAAALILAACNLPGSTPTPPPISGDWYVSPSGSDSNSCQSASDACASIGAAAGKASSGDSIAVLAGTYTEQISISKDLDIIGEGAGSTEVSGGGSGPVFNNSTGSLLISQLTIKEGSATDGGCVYNDGSLSLVDVTIRVCTADNGAAVYNAGSLTMDGSMLTNNQANIFGGGLYNASAASATIDNTTFEGNQAPVTGPGTAQGGAAIYTLGSLNLKSSTLRNNPGKEALLADDTSLTIEDSDILSNERGLASFNDTQKHAVTVTIENSTVEDHTSEGIILRSGTLQLTSTDVHRNDLNGIVLDGSNGTLSDLSLRENGNSSSDGGGLLFTDGQVTIENSLVRDNTTPGDGGGIFYSGSVAGSKLTLTNVQFTENEATNGGGLYAEDGNLELTSSEMNANTAANQGGAIYASIDPGSTFSQLFLIETSSIHANEAITGNGGGIFSIFPEMTVRQSALYNNSAASNGGAIYNGFNMQAPNPPKLNLANVTISGGNEADFGGGLALFSDYSIQHVTIADNNGRSSAGGIGFSRNPPAITGVFDNNIVADNTAGSSGTENCNFGNFAAPAQNLENLDTCGFTIPNTNPMLGPLQNNGGPTYTHALGSSSPAIDAATNTNCTSVDQRGISRPQGAACDLGAFELENPPATPTPAATATPTATSTPEAACQAELTFAEASYSSIAYREGQADTLVILEVPAEMQQDSYPATINGQSFECTTSADFPEQLFCVGPRVTEGAQAELEVFGEGCSQPVFETAFSVPFPLYPTPTPTPSPTPEETQIPE